MIEMDLKLLFGSVIPIRLSTIQHCPCRASIPGDRSIKRLRSETASDPVNVEDCSCPVDNNKLNHPTMSRISVESEI